MSTKLYNSIYENGRNKHVAFPLGGIGAGMLCLEGTGGLSHFSLRNHPDIANEPMVFSAVCIKHKTGNIARVLEGQIPDWKVFGVRGEKGKGLSGQNYGLPRFANSSFQAGFPFGTVKLTDDKIPLEVSIEGWSPFVPLDADNSSLPVAALEFTFYNTSNEPLELVYSFHAANFMASWPEKGEVLPIEHGFVLNQAPIPEKEWEQGAFSAAVDQDQAKMNYAWFRGGWFDALTMAWNSVEAGEVLEAPPIQDGEPSPGASIYVPLELAPLEQKTIRLRLSWYVPETNLRFGTYENTSAYEKDLIANSTLPKFHKPWYAGKFNNIDSVARFWKDQYHALYEASENFKASFFDSTLPAELIEAISANLSILKSPTILRQTDGRLWAWEGSEDLRGSCYGSCTHVWNYAQAIPHLFPELERSLRETEFTECQDATGHQKFRAPLPIRAVDHDFYAAADGQLGGIMKVYREWKISGNIDWLRQMWPKVKLSLDYCIETWDPMHKGILEEPHHNTYDIEFWGPNGMCTSIYLGALKAADLIAEKLDGPVDLYKQLYTSGRKYVEEVLFNGEYFEQKIQWEGLKSVSPLELTSWTVSYSPEAIKLLQEQGPKYQYGTGCLSDGIIGAWMAEMCSLGEIIDNSKVKSHLLSIYKYNLKHDLREHANPQRPGYALGNEGGLLLCTWPKGGQPALPFVYSNEVWTGIEYQVASHLLNMGCVEEALDIIRTCRSRYDGQIRNPFNEYECGHWYARALASYGLLQGITGIRYDASERKLYIKPNIAGDFRSFLSTETGYGIAGIQNGKPFFEIKSGHVEIDHIVSA